MAPCLSKLAKVSARCDSWIDGLHVSNHRLDRPGVEMIGLGFIVCGGGDNDKVGPLVSGFLAQCGTEVELFTFEVFFNFSILNGRLLPVQLVHLVLQDIEKHHFIVLRQKNTVGKPNITGASNGDFHMIALLRCGLPLSSTSERNRSISAFRGSYSSIFRRKKRLVSINRSEVP